MTRAITEIINIQALKWEARRRAAEREGTAIAQCPLITLSAEYGSQGQQVAEGVARQLAFDLFDRELLDRIVSSANASRRIVESLDDRVQDWISEYLTNQFKAPLFTSGDFLIHLWRVVLAISRHGRAVIVGRGAQFILDPRRTLRVRTVAPLPARAENVARAEGCSAEAARALIKRKTEERTAFCRLHFDRDVAAVEHYDVILNTADKPLEQSIELVLHAFRLRFRAGE